jgi:hypothetical protein
MMPNHGTRGARVRRGWQAGDAGERNREPGGRVLRPGDLWVPSPIMCCRPRNRRAARHVPSRPAAPPPRNALERLPNCLLVHALSRCDACSLLAVSQASRALRDAAADGLIWRSLLLRHHRPVLEILFGGEVPLPQRGMSWTQHYFHFARSWKRLAQQRSGCILLRGGATLYVRPTDPSLARRIR